MKQIPRGLAVLVFGVFMLAGPAQAAIIPVTLQFDNPSWSGTLSFDDTTGEPFGGLLTIFEIADMTISDGVRTWTEDELDPFFSVPPDGGLVVDTNGRAALFAIAFDTSTGAVLGFDFVADDLITHTSLVSGFADPFETLSQSDYIGLVSAVSVSVPSTLLLIASSLMGLGSVAWRCRRVVL